MNNTEFHRPFIHSLMIIVGVTIVLVASTRLLVSQYNISHQKTSSFTSASFPQ